MSYDISIVESETSDRIHLPFRHHVQGGTYCLGGTNEASLNVTYNYSAVFDKILKGEKRGIHNLEGMSVKDSQAFLQAGIDKLGPNAQPSEDYWEASEGNAKMALMNLLALAKLALTYFGDKNMVWKIT